MIKVGVSLTNSSVIFCVLPKDFAEEADTGFRFSERAIGTTV